MEFQKEAITDAETGIALFLNQSGGTISKGNNAHLLTTANSNTGYGVTTSTVEEIRLFAGIAESDVADATVGRFITYGYAASVQVFALGTSITINPGDPLGPGAAASVGVNSAGLKTAFGPVLNMDSAAITVSAGSYISGWVRAM